MARPARKPRQGRQRVVHGGSRGIAVGSLELSFPAPEGRHLENEARRRAGRQPDIAPTGAQGPMLEAPYPTAGRRGPQDTARSAGFPTPAALV